MKSDLKHLYRLYREKLSRPEYIMQDDILKILIDMESAIRAILDTNTRVWPLPYIDTKRYRRYGIGEPNTPPLNLTIAQEAAIIRQEVGPWLSIHHLLSQIQRRIVTLQSSLGTASYAHICRELGINAIHHTDGSTRPFVPTTDREISPITGSGAWWESDERRSPKFLELMQVLRQIETPDGGCIDTRDILVDYQSETPDAMMRTLPYSIVRIPRLHRTILIDDRIGEATFVFQGILDIDVFRRENKASYETNYGAKRIIYGKSWATSIERYLTTNWDREIWSESVINTPSPRIAIDRAQLFLDTDTIQKNLQKFAEAGWVSIGELSTSTPKQNTEVILSNGLKMKWKAFLCNASQYILGTENNKKHSHRQSEALNVLCEMAEVEREKKEWLTGEYFVEWNMENIRSDLRKYAEIGRVSVIKLSTTTPKQNIEVTLSNGLKMKWGTFLLNASQYVLETKKWSTNAHRRWEALDRLCKMIGVEREKKEWLTEEYFESQNVENIKNDLEKFWEIWGVGIENLTLSTPKGNTEIILSNGVKMKWDTFLKSASKNILRTAYKDKKNRHRQSEALDRVCEMVGVAREKKGELTREYFEEWNRENIRNDLEKYAETGGVIVGELSTRTSKLNVEITLSNWVNMKWATFLRYASKYILGTKDRSDNPHRVSEAFDQLCWRVGVTRQKR